MNNLIQFNIKENTIQEFADKFIIPTDAQKRASYNQGQERDKINPYSIIGRDDIFIRREYENIFKPDTSVTITLSDIGRLTDVKLVNTYVYAISEHDSLSLKLILVDFKVELLK